MNKEKEYVWYASYGSNLLESRFLCYIKGGKPNGATKSYEGCSDKTEPLGKKKIYIDREIYFAKTSQTWNRRGVGFIRNNPTGDCKTFGRMYLITKEQFIEVVKQETNFNGELVIDFDNARGDGNAIFKENSWYGNLIYLGEEEKHSIFTFTSERDLKEEEINYPSEDYLKHIIEGLIETFSLENDELENYFRTKIGIKNTVIENRLPEIIGTARTLRK